MESILMTSFADQLVSPLNYWLPFHLGSRDHPLLRRRLHLAAHFTPQPVEELRHRRGALLAREAVVTIPVGGSQVVAAHQHVRFGQLAHVP